jgi:glycosyltransferase involved in cell wall biosynthesis
MVTSPYLLLASRFGETVEYKMSNNFKISVIIPTYNRCELLQRAVLSVLKQTRPADEIIIIDDGSTDGTPELIPKKYPRIQYSWQKNTGVSAARNTGIEKSSGDWIAFLDSDDTWLQRKLEYQQKALNENPEYLFCHTNEIWIRNGQRINPLKKHQKSGGYIFERCLPLCVISPSAVILHRSLFERFGKFDTELPVCEDYDLWLRLCAFLPILYLEKPLITKYGGHADQLSRSTWGLDRFRIRALEKIITDPELTPVYKHAAEKMLITKLKIYLQGAEKRGKSDEIKRVKTKLASFQRHIGTEALRHKGRDNGTK